MLIQIGHFKKSNGITIIYRKYEKIIYSFYSDDYVLITFNGNFPETCHKLPNLLKQNEPQRSLLKITIINTDYRTVQQCTSDDRGGLRQQ